MSQVHPIIHAIEPASRRWRGGHDAAVAETRQLDLCTAACGRVVLGPPAVAARRLLATVQIDSFDAAGLAELQGLDLGMDCREEQRCNKLHGAMDSGVTGDPEAMFMVQLSAINTEQCVKVQRQQLII